MFQTSRASKLLKYSRLPLRGFPRIRNLPGNAHFAQGPRGRFPLSKQMANMLQHLMFAENG